MFLASVSRPVTPALLQIPAAKKDARRRCKTHLPRQGYRQSVRIATRSWPRGNTVECARQILMKRLGVLEEEEDGPATDDRFLQYVQLFQGPLNDSVITALIALCGLEDIPALELPQA